MKENLKPCVYKLSNYYGIAWNLRAERSCEMLASELIETGVNWQTIDKDRLFGLTLLHEQGTKYLRMEEGKHQAMEVRDARELQAMSRRTTYFL